MWGGFVIRKNYVTTEKIMDVRKWSLIINLKKKWKELDFKTVSGKHFLIFFFKSSCTPEIVLLSDQVARFFGLRISACPGINLRSFSIFNVATLKMKYHKIVQKYWIKLFSAGPIFSLIPGTIIAIINEVI